MDEEITDEFKAELKEKGYDEELSFDQVKKLLATAAEMKGEWAGIPCALEDMRLIMEPRYPYPEIAKTKASEEEDKILALFDIIEKKRGTKVVNQWYDGRRVISVVQDKNGRAHHLKSPTYGGRSVDLQINTIGAARAWDVDAEFIAMIRLRQLLKNWPWSSYVMTGSFLETSPRSKIMYMFRRCRPTLAFANDGEKVRILAALCLHPIGYYQDSFAGVLVPTDDVIAHLLLMRADEKKFWSKANQHHLWEPEAGC